MSEYEKSQSYSSPPPYNPQEWPTGFQGQQQTGFPGPQPSGYPGAQPTVFHQPTSYPPQAPQSQIIVPTTTVIQTVGFGESPTQTVCPNCRSSIITRVSSETSNCQHLLCCLMFLTMGCTICSCIPYCCDGCANVRHECPRCGTHLGSYSR